MALHADEPAGGLAGPGNGDDLLYCAENVGALAHIAGENIGGAHWLTRKYNAPYK